MSRLLKMADDRFTQNEINDAHALEEVVDGLYLEHIKEFASIVTPLLKEELRLTDTYRNDMAPAFFRMYDRPIKEEVAPGSLVSFGEFHYERKADGKIYVFPVAIILFKESGETKVSFWIYNSYTGLRKSVLLDGNVEEQIANILLERAYKVDLQFKKEENRGTPWRTVALWTAISCWAAMAVGVIMVIGDNHDGVLVAKVGFFGQCVALPLSVLAGFLEPTQ